MLDWWEHLYGDSKYLSATVTFVHLAGILLAGGFAIVTDRASLLLDPVTEPDAGRELARQRAMHRWVFWGLALIVASGGLMALADLHVYLTSVLYWAKMALFVALLANGWLRRRAEHALDDGLDAWARFRRTSLASLVLWFAVLLAGAFLPTIS